jgi:hypothetical protein
MFGPEFYNFGPIYERGIKKSTPPGGFVSGMGGDRYRGARTLCIWNYLRGGKKFTTFTCESIKFCLLWL